VDPDLSRRLRRYGDVVDAAAQAAEIRRADATSSAIAAGLRAEAASPDRIVRAGRRPPRWYTLMATAAAALAIVGGVVIANALRSPSAPPVQQPVATPSAAAVVDSTEAAATTAAPAPTTASTTSSPTGAPPTSDHTASTTRPTEPGPCPDGYHDPGTRLPLRLCDSGERVREVQQRLTETSAAGLVVDGYFGPTTRQAVRVFQEQHGLEVDGLVGPDTMAALFSTEASTAIPGAST
jgi:hypothetical protein